MKAPVYKIPSYISYIHADAAGTLYFVRRRRRAVLCAIQDSDSPGDVSGVV